MAKPKLPARKKTPLITTTRIKAPFNAPWLEIVPKKADAAALQAVRRGEANAGQQTRAMGFILETICDRNGMSFRPGPDGARETDFAEGRRFVGNQIVRITSLPLSRFEEDKQG